MQRRADRVRHQADAVAAALAQAHRSEWAFVLSATVPVAGDLDVAEGRAQEEYVSALLTFVVVIALIAMGGCLSSPTVSPGLFFENDFGSCRKRACPFAVGMKRFY